jgi:hypothetical protein
VYLGKFPQHGQNVALVLNRETGLVSPQFHVAFDPTFDTVKDITVKSKWQLRAGFVAQREPQSTPKQTKDKKRSEKGTGTTVIVGGGTKAATP